jgi:hypothetical protein
MFLSNWDEMRKFYCIILLYLASSYISEKMKSTNQKQQLPVPAMFVNESARN